MSHSLTKGLNIVGMILPNNFDKFALIINNDGVIGGITFSMAK